MSSKVREIIPLYTLGQNSLFGVPSHAKDPALKFGSLVETHETFVTVEYRSLKVLWDPYGFKNRKIKTFYRNEPSYPTLSEFTQPTIFRIYPPPSEFAHPFRLFF